jgi:hypothetical protein
MEENKARNRATTTPSAHGAHEQSAAAFPPREIGQAEGSAGAPRRLRRARTPAALKGIVGKTGHRGRQPHEAACLVGAVGVLAPRRI